VTRNVAVVSLAPHGGVQVFQQDIEERRIMHTDPSELGRPADDFDERVRHNQAKLGSALQRQYDFVVCGSGSSGSVVARRLAENPDASVLLLEAGGHDDVPAVMNVDQWPTNLGSERDWNFIAQPNPHLNGRTIPLDMGKVLGGGSSINVMIWARGHKSDWDYFAQASGDQAWSYDSVLDIYRRIEDWCGAPDPRYRGTGGPVHVEPAPDPHPIAPAALEGARSVGIATFENQNGRLMEGDGGSSIVDLRAHRGQRRSIFRSYVFPYMDRPNLTVLTGALVLRLTFERTERNRVSGVEFLHEGAMHHIGARSEVVLSLGAIHTPKVLMQSGIGDRTDLKSHGIPLVQHLQGVGHNLHDHPALACVWEYRQPLQPRNNGCEITYFGKSCGGLDSPDLQASLAEFPLPSPENAAKFGRPEFGWSWGVGVVQPKSRGRISLTGPSPLAPVQIESNMLSDPEDLTAMLAGMEMCREIGNSAALRPFTKREVMPGNLKGAELERFVRDGVVSQWHQTCTAKMGQDDMSVVDAKLKVYGVERLRIADGSIMPRVTTGNTMAPCVIIGERAAEILRADHAF
jgi:choline dehydrogenase